MTRSARALRGITWDHPRGYAALAELERLEAVSRERWVHFRPFLPTRKNPAGITDRATIDSGIAAATTSQT